MSNWNTKPLNGFKEYLSKYTTRSHEGISITWKCHLSNQVFTWENSDRHFEWLKERKLI